MSTPSTASNTDLTAIAASLRRAIAEAASGLVERETLVELIVLAAVAQEHLLVIGPPGTAKSVAVHRIAQTIGGRYFEYLLGRFTEPNEIFGPVDLRKLKEGVIETEVSGMLPEADIAFLDEIFQGSTAILNTLLGILNEREFRRGHTRIHCPLRVCVGASNALPEDESLAAFADRFLVRIFVEPIPDPMLEQLLDGGWKLEQRPMERKATMADIDRLAAAARQSDMSRVRSALSHALRILRMAGVSLSDRRVVKAQFLIAAAAMLAGRSAATEADLWPLIYVVPTPQQQDIARESLRELLAATDNSTLPSAAEQASAGPLMRAIRLGLAGKELLHAQPADPAEKDAWRLKLEGILREIDAGLAPEQMNEELSGVRAAIVKVLDPQKATGE
ncbi:MAG: AAA family ATPase [Candidatus Angelobacter sp. Gp1-AA117]|nr:MAG: AAA family ATPase [Candidatus Angelobacter sp. Gp1-AA117]